MYRVTSLIMRLTSHLIQDTQWLKYIKKLSPTPFCLIMVCPAILKYFFFFLLLFFSFVYLSSVAIITFILKFWNTSFGGRDCARGIACKSHETSQVWEAKSRDSEEWSVLPMCSQPVGSRVRIPPKSHPTSKWESVWRETGPWIRTEVGSCGAPPEVTK